MPTRKPLKESEELVEPTQGEYLKEFAKLPTADRNFLMNPNDRQRMQRQRRMIEEQVTTNLGLRSSEMLEQIYVLARNAESESVRLKASMDWLDRAGFKPVERIEHSKVVRTLEQVEGELVRLVGRDTADVLLGKRKLVNGKNQKEAVN